MCHFDLVIGLTNSKIPSLNKGPLNGPFLVQKINVVREAATWKA